jgi:hypothetical protein
MKFVPADCCQTGSLSRLVSGKNLPEGVLGRKWRVVGDLVMLKHKALRNNNLPILLCRERPPWRSVASARTVFARQTERHGGRSLQNCDVGHFGSLFPRTG